MPFDGIPLEHEKIQVLRLARSLLDNGWSQRCFVHHDVAGNPKYCVVGALRKAFFDIRGVQFDSNRKEYLRLGTAKHPADFLVLDSALSGLPLLTRVTSRRSIATLIHYNDNRGRSKQQVLNVLDRAIAKEERKLVMA